MSLDLSRLNEMQRKAATTTEGPVLIIAGAGTGKTMTLVHRLAYLIDKGVPPSGILLLTFTNKAANEMKNRACALIGKEAARVTACTYHSFCVHMLRVYAKQAGLKRNFTILSGTEEQDAVRLVAAEHRIRLEKSMPKPSVIISIISASVNRNKSINEIMENEYEKYLPYVSQVCMIRDALDKYKRENNMVNYDDMLVLFNRMLVNNADVRRKISWNYKYIMVDEYQDTNYIQDEIIWNLRQENKNIAVVGDDMQSLYGFRGADVKNIINFPKKWNGCKTIYLTRNYRSTQKILDLSNNVVINHATEGFQKVLEGVEDGIIRPVLMRTDDQTDEADKVIQNIILQHRRGVPYHEICVLYRSSFQSSILESRLRVADIPYEKYGGRKFMDHECVKDLIAYIRLVVNQQDELAWFRILQNFEGIGKINARNIASGCSNEGYRHLQDAGYAKKKYAGDLRLLHDELGYAEEMTFPDFVKELVQFYDTVKRDHIESMPTATENRRKYLKDHARDMDLLHILSGLAAGYNKAVTFLDDLILENGNIQGMEEGEDTDDRLVLSTIHSAKGLEYHTVFILDCVDGICPSTSAFEAGSKRDSEELRCFYVAITRAKRHLYMMEPERVNMFGRSVPADTSHFLDNVTNEISYA